MQYELKKIGFRYQDIVSYGNMFLIGNGHLGYRGTLEEYRAKELVGLNVVGFYDQYQDKWRESVNLPNPFFVRVYDENEVFSVLENTPLYHEQKLDILHATHRRKTVYPALSIHSKRFVSCAHDQLLGLEYVIEAKDTKEIQIDIGLDLDIYEINGPHFDKKEIKMRKHHVTFIGTTNEHKKIALHGHYAFPKSALIKEENGYYHVTLKMEKGKKYRFYVISEVQEKKMKRHDLRVSKRTFDFYFKAHQEAFKKRFLFADIKIKGNPKAQWAMRYSIYHLLILENENYTTSIPARGVSGETYKGAIFWDTEIFLLPFYCFTAPKFARQLILYRIHTLKGAKKKAKEYGYQGAFYAWESQELGQDACSKYNVTHPVTHEPIRTYFNEKQIHISADIVYAFHQYMLITGDESILDEGGYEVLKEVVLFFDSYKTVKKGIYHLNDVIGPDEYHERVDDNAFTNYMAYNAMKIALSYLKKKKEKTKKDEQVMLIANQFIQRIYLPKPNEDGIIEQFKGYFLKEDVSIEEVKKRLRYENEYWGTENGVAYPTRIIKQADVIALLCLLKERFSNETIEKNYRFYYPYTEHGSSLSASMYSMSGFWIHEFETAYSMFYKSASIDLGTEQKMFAGGIYIGGTHPASSGGAYLSLLMGFAGLHYDEHHLYLAPQKYKKLKELEFHLIYQQKTYHVTIKKDGSYEMEELAL